MVLPGIAQLLDEIQRFHHPEDEVPRGPIIRRPCQPTSWSPATAAPPVFLQRAQQVSNTLARLKPSEQGDQPRSYPASAQSLRGCANIRSATGKQAFLSQTSRSATYCHPSQARSDVPAIAPYSQPQCFSSKKFPPAHSTIAHMAPFPGCSPLGPQLTCDLIQLEEAIRAARIRQTEYQKQKERNASQTVLKREHHPVSETETGPYQPQNLSQAFCPTQHALIGGPKDLSNTPTRTPERGNRNDGREKRRRLDKFIPPLLEHSLIFLGSNSIDNLNMPLQENSESQPELQHSLIFSESNTIANMDIPLREKSDFQPKQSCSTTTSWTFLNQFNGDIWWIFHEDDHGHTLNEFYQAMNEIFNYINKTSSVEIRIT